MTRRLGRRPLVVVAAVVLAALVIGPASIGPVRAEDAPFVPGSGASSATVTKARLFYAGYTLQVPLGLSATTYENRQSRALGGAYDLTAVTGLAGVEAPEQVSPISVDSNAGDDTKTADAGPGAVLGHIALEARTVPASRAEVRLADVDLTGLVRIEGGHSHATAAVVDGNERRAAASVSVGAVSLAGGLIVLEGLQWEAVQRSGAAEQAEASFTLARVLVGGVPIATDVRDVVPVLAAINALLAPTGLVLEAPEVIHRDNGAVDITALRVGLINSPLGAEVLAPIIAGIRPLLLPAFEALAGIDGSLGLTALVADLGLGVADGSGGIEVAIGGATARTDDAVFADPLGGVVPAAPELAPAAPGPGPVVGGPRAVAAPVVGLPGTPGATELLPTSPAGPARCVLVASPRRQGSCRGSNVAGAVGVVALAVAGLGVYEALARRRDRDTLALGAGA
jgi:hypothetical protein